MTYKFIDIADFDGEARKVPFVKIEYELTEWTVLYIALFFDPILHCYKYLGSALSDKGIGSLVLLLREHITATHYAEMVDRPIDYLKKIKTFYDNELRTKPVVCFSESKSQ